MIQSNRQIVIGNGIVSATIDPSDATIVSLRYRNHEMISQSSRHRTIYFSREGGEGFEELPHCIPTIVTNTPDMIELSCKHIFNPSRGDKHAWDVDVHFILRRGMSGLYVYADCSHPADYPMERIGEWRMVWSTSEEPEDVLPNIYVDNLRHWQAPLPWDFAHAQPVQGPKEVTLLTTGLWAGRMDCKYMYNANYWDEKCWGFASNQSHLGAWVVFGSHEFFSDGPSKQDLTAAVGTILTHLNMNHYGGDSINLNAGQQWRKFYGPWLLYLNDRSDADGCWADAKSQADAEAAAWPYSWVHSPDYPLRPWRATVSGTFTVIDRLKPNVSSANAWIGLAAPESGPNTDFQSQAAGYQFWVHAKADGSFTIPAVRPGLYELYAFTTGAVGQFSRADILLRPGENVNLGRLTWFVPHHGSQIAWEIGYPNRSANKFFHGNDYFTPLLYKTLWSETPNPLDYTIGSSNWSHDWVYAQTRHGSEYHPEPARWRIHFNLATEPTDATLTLSIAGADRGVIGVFVNSQPNSVAVVHPSIEGGDALVREAVHSKYCCEYVTIPPGALHAGNNIITLVQENTRDEADYIMWDYLNLEVN